jgi:hypothetical protein
MEGGRLQRAEMVEVYRGVAKAFERGDTFMTKMIGELPESRGCLEPSGRFPSVPIFSDRFYQLRDFAIEHGERRLIFAAID